MRYRRVAYRYSIVLRPAETWPSGDIWHSDRLRLLLQPRWRPDADVYETARTVDITLDLAGVDEDDFEVQLFDNALVVEGRRRAPAGQDEAVYHVAGIRRGPFRLEVPFPARIDPEGVEARYDRGLLCLTLPKRAESR